ncbi:MAG: NADP-dependent oxidoreductase [Alphaproteobacteria bacterium]|nr:NADP-dependent oxidoreductase [Alphaproteobacteria bacterium]
MVEMNRRIVLAGHPEGTPSESHLRLEEAPVPSPAAGQFLVRNHYLSLDPYQRGRMSKSWRYGRGLGIGDVMIGGTVGEVVASRHPGYAVGDWIEGLFGWQEYALHDGQGERANYGLGLTRIDKRRGPMSTALGILGMPGETAYWSITDVARPQPGDTVVVSGAAGAVGSIAGQIAKLCGARVVGLTGSDDKVRYLTGELGFDVGINYKTTPNLLTALRLACPDRIDVYYDNVGSTIADTMFRWLNRRARVVIVGRIAQYNDTKVRLMPDVFSQIMLARATVTGFVVYDYDHRTEEARGKLAAFVNSGRLRYHETIAEGIESAPAAFLSMLNGGNLGKQLVRLYPRLP